MNAILNRGRLNAFRLNYIDPALKAKRDAVLRVTLDGVPLRVRWQTLSIRDVINDAPNTCRLVVDAATPPTVGKRLRVTLGVDPSFLLFVGPLQAARQTYAGRAATLEKAWDCEAVDDTNRADWRRPFGAWEGVSASQMAADLVSQFAPGFTAAGVQAGLPPVTVYLDGSERMNGALRQLAKLIGGYFYWDNLALHLFTDAEAGATPDPITGTPGQLLDDPRISYTSDDAQIRTRCYGKGHGEATLTAVNAGETQLPIASSVMFNAAGGRAISEWQRLTYTGTVPGGAGALVGPGVSPSVAPLLTQADGTGVNPGAHDYAYTWVKASPPGETLPSPVGTVTASAAVSAPALNSVSTGTVTGGPPAGTLLRYKVALQGVGGAWSPASAELSITSTGNRPIVTVTTTADMRGRYILIARSDGADNWTYWAYLAFQGPAPPGMGADPLPINYPIGVTISVTDVLVSYTHGSSIPFPPVAPTLAGGKVNVTGIAAGPSGTTSRNLYRTVVGSAQLKLIAAINDNTTTTYADTTPDASLGANAPTADTSGFQMPAGIVAAGSTSMVVASTVWTVASGGGWAVIGNGDQVIRYTGATGNTLTGIPASGIGAIVAPVNYNSTITGAPMLIGVAGIVAPIREGAPVNIWVQVDDTDAQSAYATRTGTDGIVENLIVDERRGVPSLQALCAADLQMYARPIVTIRYACFDPKTKSGRPVRVTLPALGIDETLTIQDVTIDTVNNRMRFAVTASSVRQSLDDIFRRLVGTLDEGF